MEVYICFYTNEKFRVREDYLTNHYQSLSYSNILPYRSENVKIGEFYNENKEFFIQFYKFF